MDGRRPPRRATYTLAALAAVALAAGLGLVAQPAQAAMPGTPPATGSAVVEQQVEDELAAGGTTDFWVYLDERAELGAAPAIADRAVQGRYVYQQLTGTARSSQAGLLAMLAAQGATYQPFWIANAVKVTGDAQLLRRIEQRPEVAQVAADRVYELPEPIPAEAQLMAGSVEWGVDRINAPQVWDEFGTTGEGIVVGTIDSGVLYTHPALVEQYRGNLGDGEFDHNYHWHDPSSVCGVPSLAPCDNSGHGTHVTGTIVGSDGGDNRIGVAPGAQWIAAKGCESRSCSQAALLSSGQFMLAPTDLDGQHPRPELRPHIVNNSWGGGATTDPWYRPTVEAWVAAGIFPQFAGGNWSQGTAPCGTASNPGNLPESYAAGAFDIDGNIAGFSNRGPSAWGGDLIKPDIAAPGVAVRSAWFNGGYQSSSGTSMAAPHVAGTVALIWSAALAIERDIEATRQLLDDTAVDVEDLSCGGTASYNNVWGQGQLDAFAAVAAAPRGPVGQLAGRVTDQAGGDPVAGATVAVAGETSREETTGSDGAYQFRLPAGDYQVTVSAFAYHPQVVPATVVADETLTLDFELSPVDSVTVSGRITDGSGHGWPLHASVEVVDTPVTAFTDPLTGDYQLRVPAHGDYQLRVESQYPGYDPATATVEVASDDVSLDLALVVDRCHDAPGYEWSGDVAVLDSSAHRFAPYLEERGIPVARIGWGDDPTPYDVLIVNIPGFLTGNPLLDVIEQTDASGTSVMFLDSFNNGSGIWLLNNMLGNPSSRTNGFSSAIPYLYYEVTQEHPILAGFEVGDEIIFDEVSTRKDFAWFDGYTGEGREVIAHAGRGDTGTLGPGIGIQQREDNRHVLLSMHAAGAFSGPQNWSGDAHQLFDNALRWLAPEAEFECQQVAGGLVVGTVADRNTGHGVNGAAVTGPAGEPANSFAPADPALDDGFYWRFTGTGSQQLSASADRYVEDTRTVEVAASAVTELDFSLPAGQLAVDASEVTAELRLGQSTQQEVTFTNTGTGPAELALTELADSFEILGGSGSAPAGAAGAEVTYLEGEFSPAPLPTGDRLAGEPVLPQSVPAAEPWTDLPNYPTSIMDSATEELDGSLFSFGGYNGSIVLRETYVFNPRAGVWTSAASMPEPRQRSAAVAIDGLIYVVGGWDREFEPVATTYIYDPSTNEWSQGAPMPAPRAAFGAGVLDGQLYVVGGCAGGCDPMTNTAWRYDPAADEWEALANYPRTVSWLGCGGLADELVCAGGHDGLGGISTAFAYQPATGQWSPRANLPYPNWGMGYAVANGQLVFTGGIALSAVTNRSASYLPGQDWWVDIEPANIPVYRGSAACGLYRVGGSLVEFNPVAHSEQHPDFDDCVREIEVTWLAAGPPQASLAPGESVTVTVSLDSDQVDQPGSYAAGISIGHDTPYQVDPIGVTMVVTPPNNWVKLTGTVRGVDCFGGVSRLAGAVVQIEGKHSHEVLWAGEDGSYTYWVARNEAPLELLVTAAGHLPEHRTVRPHPNHDNVEDFALRLIC